jgi:Bacterial alpha-L-rhamnosidase 6 hairpin glycosidase domain
MGGRREFLKSTIAGAAAWMLVPSFLEDVVRADGQAAIGAGGLGFNSEYILAELSSDAPEFTSLSVDGLGKGRRGANIVDPKSVTSGFKSSSFASGETLRIEYYSNGVDKDAVPEWTIEFASKSIVLTSEWSPGADPVPMFIRFNLPQVHSTVLGVFRRDNLLSIPALMHFPGQGSMRITANVPDLGLTYQSTRRQPIASLMFSGATFEHKHVVYTLDVTAIYPDVPGIADDVRFDAFRRNWLNILQVNPAYPALANNTASTSCAFCYYEFADIAALTPPLAEGLTALDVVRMTLDRVLAGGTAYGLPMPGNFPTPSSDTFPSMLIAAADCVRAGESDKWLAANYEGIRGWAESMLATDTDGNGLFKYSVSGNSGIWPDGFPMVRPSNWWDTIGFGHEDAYGNALAFRALRDLAMMAVKLGKSADAARYQAAAEKLRRAYYDRFFDPETDVLGGWRSADGKLHDYYFLWVNGIAIHYGLVEKPQANAIMDKLLAKMKEVGYDKFNMGLPGNLITVALKDYVHKTPDGRFGGGVLPDNSDGFQNYENGGATGCFAFFTLAALYDLGRNEEADQILFAMLGEFDHCGFEGFDAKNHSYDWRRWDGTAMGGEGFLADNYYTLLAVPLRHMETTWQGDFRGASFP